MNRETIVLVCGFLSPTSQQLLRNYWGSASEVAEEMGNVDLVFPPVSSMGSAHDRACEVFAFLTGTRVSYGEEHSAQCSHFPYGEDFSPLGAAVKSWNEDNPIHLVGHSFGGNTIRYLVYLLSIDFFKCGTNSRWIKSVSTLSSPLLGSLLTYALGTVEDESEHKPVKSFSIGYTLGLFAHLYSVTLEDSWISKISGLNYKAGLDHFGVKQQGIKGFFTALFGGSNGGGTPPVCERDCAPFDMSVPRAQHHADLYKKHVKNHHLFEFHFVCSSALSNGFTVKESVSQHFSSESPNTRLYSSVLFLRDFVTYHMANRVRTCLSEATLMSTVFSSKSDLDGHMGDTDGLCAAVSQFVLSDMSERFNLRFDSEKLLRTDFVPGSYRVDLKNFTHFSIVPFPDDSASQKQFFNTLFNILAKIAPKDARKHRIR